jgi:hypothetical protein
MRFRGLLFILQIITGTIAVASLVACRSTEKTVSTGASDRIPRKIVTPDDLPPGIQFTHTGRTHYVQLYPEEKPETRQPAIEEKTIPKEEPRQSTKPNENQAGREDAVKDLINTRTHLVYYIVAGSFQIKQNALSYAEKMKKQGFENCEVLISDDLYHRVILEKFISEKEAVGFVKEFTEAQRGGPNMWILQNK